MLMMFVIASCYPMSEQLCPIVSFLRIAFDNERSARIFSYALVTRIVLFGIWSRA